MTMLVFVGLLILMMAMMKIDAESAETITAHNGEAVVLTSDLQGAELAHMHDIRWTHDRLVLSLKNNATTCHHGRCELLRDGSLIFSHVQTEDEGKYILEVFDIGGKILMRREVLLVVKGEKAHMSSSSVSVLTCCFLLLLFFIIIFILRRRRKNQRTKTTTGPLQENVHVMSNKSKDDEEKQGREEESHYVPCNPVVSIETPIIHQASVEVDDVYV